MKRFLILLSLLFCNVVFADTINLHWRNYDGTIYQDSTCEIDSDLILPPTPPTKYGYTFTGWKIGNYIPIEYLESTGTQWIDTNVIQSDYKQNLIIVLDLQFTELPNSNWIKPKNYSSGCSNNITNQYFFPLCIRDTGMFSSNIGDGDTDIDPMMGDLNRHKIICNTVNATLTIDNKVFNYRTNTANINKSIHMFISNAADNSTSIGKVKFYSAKFLLGDNTIVRDFIPVLDENDVPCMFDKVEGKFYYNQGTGQFIAGPSL